MFAIAVHGGAGALSRHDTSVEQEQAYRAGLSAALDAGYAVLERGAPSLDAAIAAVCVLEDNPLFNAGRGAVQHCPCGSGGGHRAVGGRGFPGGKIRGPEMRAVPVPARRATH